MRGAISDGRPYRDSYGPAFSWKALGDAVADVFDLWVGARVARLIARPMPSRVRSIRTSGWIDAQRRFFRRIARSVPTSRLTVLGAAPFSRRSA